MINETGEHNMNFIKKDDLDNFTHLQIPRMIWNLFLKKKIDQSTFKIYIELFDRVKMSAYNNWIDEDGNVYIKYSYDELKDILGAKSDGTIANALKQLKELNLLTQVKGFNTSSIFYLTNILEKEVRNKINEKLGQSNKINSSSKNCSTTKKCSTVLQKIEEQSSKKLEANHNNYNHNNLNNKIMNHDIFNIFENLFKELEINFTIKNQNSVAKLLKTQTIEEVKTYLIETLTNIKMNPEIKNPSGVFTKKIEKRERQAVITPKPEKAIESLEIETPIENNVNPGYKKATIHLEKQKEIRDILTKENKEKEILNLYFDSLSKSQQENIMLDALKLAKVEMNGSPDKVIEITSKRIHKYTILKSLYERQMEVI